MNNIFPVELKDATNLSFKFNSFIDLKEFITKEFLFWKKQKDYLSSQKILDIYLSADIKLKQVYILISKFEKIQGTKEQVELKIDNNQLQIKCQNLLNHDWLWSGHSYTLAFIDCHKKYGFESVDSFLRLVQEGEILIVESNEKKSFEGLKYGFKFLKLDLNYSLINESGKISLDRLKKNFIKTKSELLSEEDIIKREFKKLELEFKRNLEKLSAEEIKNYSLNKMIFEEKFNNFKTYGIMRLNILEKAYQELIKIKRPEEYWHNAMIKYKKKYYFWFRINCLYCLMGFVAFCSLIFNSCRGQENVISIFAGPGLFVLISILVLYIYIIKVFSRFISKNFQLMEDSQKNELKSHLYINYIND